jgi:membrane complex biogenesis BtpA family protein
MKRPRLVGVIHLPPLPGSPRWQRPIDEIAAGCAEAARILNEAGYDMAMIENFGDAPFHRGPVPPITVSAMTASAVAARRSCPTLPLGINVLRNDAHAALAIAACVGASAIRVNIHTGARVTDQGVIEGDAAATLRTRRALGIACEIWADVDVKHSAPLAPRAPDDDARDLVARGLADAVLVTGESTGRAVDLAKLASVRAATAGVPLYVASGATDASLDALAAHADGVIVGSALRANAVAGGPIDPNRASAFARAFRTAFR